MTQTRRGFGSGKGRKRGTPNKVTSLIAAAVIAAAERKGNGSLAGYFDHLCDKHPDVFASLVRTILRTQYKPAWHDHRDLKPKYHDEDEDEDGEDESDQ